MFQFRFFMIIISEDIMSYSNSAFLMTIHKVQGTEEMKWKKRK
jgi:hypothetical protein